MFIPIFVEENKENHDEVQPSTSNGSGIGYFESFGEQAGPNSQWTPALTFAYDEFGQEIAVGLDVTEYFDVANEVQVIGEATFEENDAQQFNEDSDQDDEDCPTPPQRPDTPPSQRSAIIKRYTSSKTKMVKKFKTLMEKKKEIKAKAEEKRQTEKAVNTKYSKGKASDKFPPKSSAKVKKGVQRKVKPKTGIKETAKMLTSRKLQSTATVQSARPKKLSTKKNAEAMSKSERKHPKNISRKISISSNVIHIYASIPQPKIRQLVKKVDPDYKPTTTTLATPLQGTHILN